MNKFAALRGDTGNGSSDDENLGGLATDCAGALRPRHTNGQNAGGSDAKAQCKGAKQNCGASDLEYTVEMTPAYEETVKVIADLYGVDSESKFDIYANYVQPRVLRGNNTAHLPQHSVHRKEGTRVLADERPQEPKNRGFINVCVEFLHATLAYVRPPQDWTHDETTVFIRQSLDERLRRLANRQPLTVKFEANLHEVRFNGCRRAWHIRSNAELSQQHDIESLRQGIKEAFIDNGFYVRLPREHATGEDESDAGWRVIRKVEHVNMTQIHMTIRDERYESLGGETGMLPLPKKLGTLNLMFDNLAVTPAAGNDPRHSFRRQFCGATHIVPFVEHRPGGLRAHEPVIEECRHGEEAVVVHPDEAAQTVAQLVVGTSEDATEADAVSEKVFLHKFGDSKKGSGESFRQQILHGDQFKLCIEHLKQAGYPPVLSPSKMIVLVHPDQYLDVINALRDHDKLAPYMLALSESMAHLLDEILKAMPTQLRPREKKAVRQEIDLSIQFEAQRTFLCEVPKRLMPTSVAQSTTGVVNSEKGSSSGDPPPFHYSYKRGVNPRQCVA